MALGITLDEFKKDPTLVDKGAELRLTKDEAGSLFGSDFTGLRQSGGFFVPDSSALQRLQSGAASPTSGAAAGLPPRGGGDFGSFFQNLQGLFPTGLASSTNLEDEFNQSVSDIQQQQIQRRAQLTQERQGALAEGREFNEKTLDNLEGTLKTATGGELGFSSIEQSIVQNQIKRNDKRLNDINAAYDKALLDNDVESAKMLREERASRIQMALQLEQAYNQRILTGLGIRREEREARQADRQFGLQERQFGLQEQQFALQSEEILAGLTGTFRGQPTFQAEQAALKNMLDIAGLTGEFNGAPTVAEKQRIADEAYQKAQLTGVFEGQPTLQSLSLAESIRSNKAQEALQAQANKISAAKGSSDNSGQNSSKVVTFFENIKDDSGFVSPEDYTKAKNAWVSDGGKATDFDNNFLQYVRKEDRERFGLEGSGQQDLLTELVAQRLQFK